MTKSSPLLTFLTVILLTGCFPAYVNHEYPDMYKDSVSLEQLIGRDKRFVVDRFGKPDQKLTDGSSEFYIYQDSAGGSTEVIFLLYMLLPYASETKGDLVCLLFTISDENTVQEYQIKAGAITDNMSINKFDTYCRSVFWENAQLEKIKPLPGT